MNGKCNNISSADENKYKKKKSLQKFLLQSEAEIQGLIHPSQARRGRSLAWFQSLQLPSTPSESPLALIPLAPKCHVYF
jgi:hypothetical protein